MKLNKRMLSLLLALMMVISLTACTSDAAPETTSMEVTEAAETPESTTDVEVETADETALEDAVNDYFANIPEHIYKISQVEFVDMVQNGDDMFILDIRSADDYAAGHVEGAVNAPWGTAISDNLSKIPADMPVFVYCYSGQTAGQAVHTLNVAGFDARSVNLGWNFGISKVEGVDAVTTTEATAFGDVNTAIDPEIQTALDAYYAGLAEVKGTTYGNYKISEDSLNEMLQAGDDSIYLLSIRSEKDYNAGHIQGAELLPYGSGMQEGFADLPKDKTIVVYCYSGQTAGQTVAGLRLSGYDAVSLNGGMGVGSNAPIGWTNKGYAVANEVTTAVSEYYANMPEHIYKIGQADFVEMVQNGDDMFILDIRSADDYAAGHVQGAVNAPWGTAISDSLSKIPADKPVFVYCYSGQTAGQAVHTLNVAGFDARSVNLGWNFGISKVDGVDAITTTETADFGGDVTEIAPAVQTALDAYYAGLAEVKGTVYGNYKVSEENLNKMIESGDDSIYVLSIRSEKDYNEGHIQGAERLSFNNEMVAGFADLPTDKTIVVYCYSGQTAGQTVAALRLMGYDAVSLNGGMGVGSNAPIGWINQEYAVVK